MAELKFEEVLGPGFTIGGGADVTVEELPGPFDWPADLKTARIIQRDQDFNVAFAWTQHGPLTEIISEDLFWRVELLVERMGGDEFTLPAGLNTQDTDYVADEGHTYNVVFNIPASVFPPGVYRFIGMVNLRGPGLLFQGIAGFCDMGLMQIYED